MGMADVPGPLSEREIEVLKLVATGATNQQIARALVISPNTVKVHLRNVFEKLGVQSRTEATMDAVRRGWVTVPGAASFLGERAAQAEEPEAAPLPAAVPAPATPRVTRWQRAYMIVAAWLVLLALLLPAWLKGRGQALLASSFTDAGQPQVAAAPRPQVDRWVSRDPLPEPRSRLALASDGTRLYAIGGEAAGGRAGRERAA